MKFVKATPIDPKKRSWILKGYFLITLNVVGLIVSTLAVLRFQNSDEDVSIGYAILGGVSDAKEIIGIAALFLLYIFIAIRRLKRKLETKSNDEDSRE